MKVRRGAARRGGAGNYTYLVQILIVTILVLLWPNPVHIPNIGVTSCLLGDNPQTLNVQRNLYLCTLFQRNLQILESSKPPSSTSTTCPSASVGKKGSSGAHQTPKSKGPQSYVASPLHLTHSASHMRSVL